MGTLAGAPALKDAINALRQAYEKTGSSSAAEIDLQDKPEVNPAGLWGSARARAQDERRIREWLRGSKDEMDRLAASPRADRAWQRICRSATKQKRASPGLVQTCRFIVGLLKTICGATRFDKVAKVLPKAKRNYVKDLKWLCRKHKRALRIVPSEEEWRRLDSAYEEGFRQRIDPRTIRLSGGRRSDKGRRRVIMMVSQDLSGLVYGLTG